MAAATAGRDRLEAGAAWRVTADGLSVTVRVTPRSGRDAIEGIETAAGGRRVLKVRVGAVPADGQANDALRALLAGALRVPSSRVKVVAGSRSRIKVVAVEGNGTELAAVLATLARQQTQ